MDVSSLALIGISPTTTIAAVIYHSTRIHLKPEKFSYVTKAPSSRFQRSAGNDGPNLVCLKLLDGEGSYFSIVEPTTKWAAFSSSAQPYSKKFAYSSNR